MKKIDEKVDSKEKFYSDIRIISTNSKNLNDSNNKLNINIDLYNRLKVIEIMIPPLSKRVEDIKLLCDYFIKNSKFTLVFNKVNGISVFK